MQSLYPSCHFENILSAQFYIKASSQNFYVENDQKCALISYKQCLLNHHFSPHLVHAHSKQLYYTRDLAELYMTPFH